MFADCAGVSRDSSNGMTTIEKFDDGVGASHSGWTDDGDIQGFLCRHDRIEMKSFNTCGMEAK